jgi:hypothetical protein
MPPKLPVLKPKQVIAALLRAGLYVHHQKGSYSRMSGHKVPTVLWTDNFEPLKPAAFVFGNIDIAFGIHRGTNGIEELALEEQSRAVADSRHDLPCLVIQDIDFPLVLIDDVDEPLIGVARELDRNR